MEQPYVKVNAPKSGVQIVKWSGVTSGDTFRPWSPRNLFSHDCSVQVDGDLGGGTLTIKGSLDPSGAFADQPLTDPQGVDLDFAAPGLKTILQPVYSITPVLVGGAAASFSVIILMGGGR